MYKLISFQKWLSWEAIIFIWVKNIASWVRFYNILTISKQEKQHLCGESPYIKRNALIHLDGWHDITISDYDEQYVNASQRYTFG